LSESEVPGSGSGSDVPALRAEVERLHAAIDERLRERSRLEAEASRVRAESIEIEAEAERMLRRLLVMAREVGMTDVAARVQRELRELAAEGT
jgi:uncharacterized protein YlxW (UPF0749 family)